MKSHSVADLPALLESLVPLIREAGAVIMDIYATDFDVTKKGDDSPVTQADERAEAVILAGLARLAPGIPVVAEEAVAAGHIPEVGEYFFLVDPLDGTKEFLKLRTTEADKVRCGKKHFETLGVPFAVVVTADDV